MVNHNYFTQRDVERLEEQAVQINNSISYKFVKIEGK